MTIAAKPKRPVHPKRNGLHHKRTKHFTQTYWPYLPLIAIVVLGAVLNSLWLQPRGGVLGYTVNISDRALLQQTNEQRLADNEQAFVIDEKLTAAAQAKANDMVRRNYWAHNTPTGETPWSFITAAGYTYAKAGENLAYGFDNAKDTVIGWMNSPEHRANILGSYTEVGFGIASSPDYNGSGPETVIVAMYGEPAAVTTASAITSSSALSQGASTIDARHVDSEPVARIQLITAGQAPWSLLAMSTLLTLATMTFIIRHGKYWHRVLVRGEAFVMHHPLLDVVIVTTATAGFLLSRAGGFIQ